MKQKVLSVLVMAAMFTSFFGSLDVSANDENISAAPIKLGAYVRMGAYDINKDGAAEPILWRCVAFEKVTGSDADGNPITDSTQTVTEYRDGYLPLMISDVSICKKPFDMPGSNKSGSHGRSEKRPERGSNYWADSNIRDWLNSCAISGKVIYTCGNNPLYSDEAGFLNNFTAEEKAAMNTAVQKSILTGYDKNLAGVSGKQEHTYNNSVLNAVQNYKDAYSEQVTDTMFLLDVQQVKNIYDNFNDYYEPYKDTLYYWLRTPAANLDYLARVAFLSGEVNEYTVESSNVGIRPAFYLNPSAVLYGEGSRYYPHTIVPTHTHYMSAEYNYENAVTFDRELTCADGRLYVDGDIIDPVTESGSDYIDLPAGNYYLTENLSINTPVRIKSNVNLCLNGKTLNMGESGIEVSGETGIFGLCDCGVNGTITSSYHTGDRESALITASNNGIFSIYRGRVINTSDRKYSYKQAVSAVDGEVRLYGGEIAAADDNAVYFGSRAVGITLSGAPKIKGSGSKSDIYLYNIGNERLLTIDAPLKSTEPYRIGTMRTDVFTNGWNKNMAEKNIFDYFISAVKGKFIDKNKSGELEVYDYTITEQMSAENGNTVTVNGTPVSYVWYPAEVIVREVTAVNASVCEYNGQLSAYDSENGWIGAKGAGAHYFKIALSEGEILKVKPSAPVNEFAIVSLTNTNGKDFQDAVIADSEGEYVFTAEADAEYTLSIEGISSWEYPPVKAAAVRTVLGSAVKGQTTNKFTGSAGSYLCEITYADGTVLRSDVAEASEYVYDIKYESGSASVTVPEDGTYTVIFAAYDLQDGGLLSISAEDIRLTKGRNEPIKPKQGFAASGKVKAMLWNSLNGMKPLCASNED